MAEPSFYSPVFDDIYFSAQGGLAEKRMVFLEGSHLPARWQSMHDRPCVIAETGFGLGLSFMATWQAWETLPHAATALHYISIEAYPVAGEAIAPLGECWPELKPYIDRLLSHYPSPENAQGRVHLALTETVHLTLLLGDIASMLPAIDQPVDAWYLDGFTPAKNPDMWDERLFEHMQHHTQPGGTCATYTAASFVRRGLQQAGFDVQKVPGYGRKREMITGTFRGAAAAGACP